ncbi:MAG: DUF1858 domain-containing protein [Candidatus Pacearchaeota archaeon]|nr:DUF1858 domain-containing protein [Candidatus Pacearchaeota archaeon]
MNQTKRGITKKTTFAQLLDKYPEAAEILFEEGMSCVGCPMAMQETIEQGCKAHGIDIKKFLARLNKKIKNK